MAGRFLRELTIRQLRALAAVQKHHSVTAAAKQLHLTQPAVTLQLRNLQALAELPLIQRTSDGMLLTDAGREVLLLASRIESAIADCATSLEMMAGKTAGRISIGAVSTAKYFVPFMISGFSKRHPNIDVTRSAENRHGDEQQRDDQAGCDRGSRNCIHFGAHGCHRTRRASAGHARRGWSS